MFVIIPASAVLAHTDDPAEAIRLSADYAMIHQDELVTFAEIVVPFADPRTAIPGELDRAIDAWNAMTARVKTKVPGAMHIRSVEKRANYVKPYRKWRDAIGERFFLLEELPLAVEEQPFLWPTITFGWLFGRNRQTGEFHADKVHARAYGKAGNGGNGQATERDYLQVAARVAAYNKFHVDGESFEYGTGVTWEKWQQLQKQFDGKAAT